MRVQPGVTLCLLLALLACDGARPVDPNADTAYFGAFLDTAADSATWQGITIESEPAGIRFVPGAGGTTGTRFSLGTRVTLRVTTGPAVTFQGWSGECSGQGDCTVTLTHPEHAVGAHFAPVASPRPPGLRLFVERLYTGSPAPDTLGRIYALRGSEGDTVVACVLMKVDVPFPDCGSGRAGLTFPDTTTLDVVFRGVPEVRFRGWYFPGCGPEATLCRVRVDRLTDLHGRLDIGAETGR